MAYYLTIEKKKGYYVPLEITKSKYFSRLSNLKGNGSTLQEIDMFTMMFDNEKQLRAALFKEKLVDTRDAGRGLSIRILRNNCYYKVMYDMMYQKDMEYIANPKLLIKRINDKLLEGDYRFVEKFANTFLNFHDCLSTAPEVREFAISSSRDEHCCKYFYSLDENGDNPLIRMAKLLIYDYKQNPNGKVEYKDTVKYRNLHAVLAFVDYYNKKFEKENKDNKQINLFTSEDKVKTKKKEKNKYIPGQTSLFNE